MNDYRAIRAEKWYARSSNMAFLTRCLKVLEFTQPAIENTRAEGRFHPVIAYQEHLRSVAWLERRLAERYSGPTVVVTHHAPTFESLRKFGIRQELLDPTVWGMRYRDDDLLRVAAYASPLEDLLRLHRSSIDVWAHGHLHAGMDVLSEGVRVVSNPRGYALRPLDQKSARAFAFFGVSVSEAEIAESQAVHAKVPFRGDAVGFEPDLVIDFEHGFERPIAQAIEEPLRLMQALVEDARSLLPHVIQPESVPHSAVLRCFEMDVDEFCDTLRKVQEKTASALDPYVRTTAATSLEMPQQQPWFPRPFHNKEVVLEDFERTVKQMVEWCNWTTALPDTAARVLQDWARMALSIISLLERERGLVARVYRRPVAALRVVGPQPYQLCVDADESVCNAVEQSLDARFNKTTPRRYLFYVQPISDVGPSDIRKLLSAGDLEKFEVH